jgi:hypothetical protein
MSQVYANEDKTEKFVAPISWWERWSVLGARLNNCQNVQSPCLGDRLRTGMGISLP